MARWIILPFLGLTLLAGAVGGYLILDRIRHAEARLRERADGDYEKMLFDAAKSHYEALRKNFPESEHAEHDELRLRLCDILARIHAQPDEPGVLLDNIEQMVKDYAKKPILSDHARALGDGLIKLMSDFGAKALEQPDLAAGSEAFEKARKVVAAVKAVKLPKGAQPPDFLKIDDAARKLHEAIQLATQRKKVLDALRALTLEPSYQSLLLARRLQREEGSKFPGLEGQFREAIEEIKKGHLAAAGKYVRAVQQPEALPLEVEDEPAILIDSLQQGQPGSGGATNGVALALCRGVLYGLSRASGQVRWAMRVGIDTTALPVHVPASLGTEERFLVLSSDTRTLSAVDSRGSTLWRYHLGAPSLGRPAVVGNRAYLGTYAPEGEVHEVELSEGKLIGKFALGQPLAVGGAFERETGRLYFAAEAGCVYVLKTGAQPGLERIIYTDHPAGSLQAEPVVVPREFTGGPRYLVLALADGLRSMELKAFEQQEDGQPFEPAELTPRPRLEGWTWFPSHYDAEKIVLLTDAGVLGAFGIKQGGLRDRALVPLLPEGGLRLPALGSESSAVASRAAVMQLSGDDLWALGRGRLQRYRREWGQQTGPMLAPLWSSAPVLGSPLHRGQAWATPSGQGRLLAVTQPIGRAACLATCVDDERGSVIWQRQLGLVCQGQPVSLPADRGPPLWLALDQGGSLFALDPNALTPRRGAQWVPGRLEPIAGPLAPNPRVPTSFLTQDGKSWLAVSCPGGGATLVIRHVMAARGRAAEVAEREVQLRETIAGPPALMNGRILVPLADGALSAVPLGGGPVSEGPDWRSPRLGRETEGYVLGLGDRLITCDGGRGLSVWDWPIGKAWSMAPPGIEPPALELPGRIVAPPLALPGPTPRFAVADDTGGLSIIEMKPDGALIVKDRVDLGAAATSPPFLAETPAGPRVGVVVARSRLAWVNPGGEPPAWAFLPLVTEGGEVVPADQGKASVEWEHATRNDSPILGVPSVVGSVVVVVDQSGRYTGLSLRTGREEGAGHSLRGSIAPASGAVPFQPGRLLAPLTDGTLMLLDEGKVHPDGKALPPPRELLD
jgi:hypothetical protein